MFEWLSLGCSLFSNLRLAPLFDHSAALALFASLRTKSRKTPRSLRMISLHTAFTTAVRMIHRLPRHAAHRGPLAMPSRATCFPVGHIFVIQISKLDDGSHALNAGSPDLTRRQLHEGEIVFLAQELRCSTGGANHLPAFAGKKLEIVNHGPGRNMPKLHGVAGKDVGAFAVLHRHADFQAHGLQNVTLL